MLQMVGTLAKNQDCDEDAWHWIAVSPSVKDTYLQECLKVWETDYNSVLSRASGESL